eukprot:TRINITY_DN29860_c0_g1_i1.p1 TRINITY_DN29860_c0_g1~~TRINITY_DN29860_c0_g1_i1.p1  ORF type:complete len:816 (+),score=159.79 TRINITY_DN29860_c0_g1_i1:44-2491(+)
MAEGAGVAARQAYDTAETLLRDEQIEDCLREISRAVTLFERLGTEGVAGLTDALVMQIDVLRQLANARQEKPQRALDIAWDRLEQFRAAGDRRGEASMLSALASIDADKRGRVKRAESLETAAMALEIFREIEDRKSEACTLNIMANAHYKSHMYGDMLHEAQLALEILEEQGDKFHTARASYLVGLAMNCHKRFEPALEKARECLAIHRELGLKRQEAIHMHSMAGWLNHARWPRKALAVAERALEMFRSLGPGGLPGGEGYRREASCVNLNVEILMDIKQYKSALKLANSAFDRFVDIGSNVGQAMVKESLSRIYTSMDKTDKAIEAIDAARQIAEGLGDKKWSAKLLSVAARAQISGKATEQAIETLDKSITLAHAAGDLQEMNQIQQNLIDLLLFRRGQPKAALRVARESRALAQKSGDKRSEGFAALREGVVQATLGNQEEGIKLAREAQEMYQESHCPLGESQCLEFIAEMYSDLGQMEAALESAEERVSVLRESNDLSSESDAMVQLAKLHMKDENFDEAHKLADEARQLGKQDRNPVAEILALKFFVEMCCRQIAPLPREDSLSKRLLDRAVRSANEALQLSGKAENRNLRAAILYVRSEALALASRHKSALRDVKEAARIFESMGNQSSLGRCLLVSGNFRHILGDIEHGLADMEKATAIAHDTSDSALADEVAAVRRRQEEMTRKRAEAERAPHVIQPDLEVLASRGPDVEPQQEEASEAAPVSRGLERDFVRKTLAALMKDAILSEDDENLELDSTFMDSGLDSLASIALTSMVSKEFSILLSPSVVFDFPTLRALEDHVMTQV